MRKPKNKTILIAFTGLFFFTSFHKFKTYHQIQFNKIDFSHKLIHDSFLNNNNNNINKNNNDNNNNHNNKGGSNDNNVDYNNINNKNIVKTLGENQPQKPGRIQVNILHGSNSETFQLDIKDPDDKPYVERLFSNMSKTVNNVEEEVENLHQKINESTINEKLQEQEKKRSLIHQIYKSGFGVRRIKAPDGSVSFHENGIIYKQVEPAPAIDINNDDPNAYHAVRDSNFEPYIPFNETSFFETHSANKEYNKAKKNKKRNQGYEKIILWYTPARYTKRTNTLDPLRFCPELPCRVTTNRKYKNEAAMMAFNGQELGEFPPTRGTPDQIFLFHNQEPPIIKFFRNKKHYTLPQWRDQFNWTMSFRSDSTIPSYYGIARKFKSYSPSPPKDYAAILKKKINKVAWIVSHCNSPSGRDQYVKELQKYIQVDIYGRCGTFKCPLKDDSGCRINITTTYKFYLGFENAFCPDYLTEKFYRQMPKDIITVSRGDQDAYTLHVPQGISINTADFESPKKLAERLNYLDKHDEDYIAILKEKDSYVYLMEDYPILRGREKKLAFLHHHFEAVPFCEVCRKLWNLNLKERQIIPDIKEWFEEKQCVPPTDLNWKKD